MPVTDCHRDYRANVGKWCKCRDVLAGQDEMLLPEKREKYIRRLSGHRQRGTTDLYPSYASGAILYDAVGRIHDGLLGLIQRKEPVVTAPAGLKTFLADATGSGVSFRELLIRMADEVLGVGRCGVLVDFPSQNTEGMTTREIENAGIEKRPFATLYTAEDIRDWWELSLGGSMVLQHLVLQEQIVTHGIAGDPFATVYRQRYRVLDLVTYLDENDTVKRRLQVQYWAQPEPKDKPELWMPSGAPIYPKIGNQPITSLPFVWCNAKSTTWTVDKPPHLGMVNVSIGHFNNSASYEHGLVLAGSPTPVIFGFDRTKDFLGGDGTPKDDDAPVEIRMGGGTVWTIANAQGSIDKMSFSAEDLAALEKAMAKKEEQLVVIGSRMLTPDDGRRPAESGIAKRVEREGENSALATIAEMVSRAGEKILEWARDYSLLSGSVKVDVNKDFYGAPLTPDEARAAVELWVRDGVYAKSDARRILRRGEWIDAERTDKQIDAELELDAIPTARGLSAEELRLAAAENEDEDEEPEAGAAAAAGG